LGFLILLFIGFSFTMQAQIQVGDDDELIDYTNPKEYEIGGITISGIKYLDHKVLVMLSGLAVLSMIFCRP